MTETCSLFEGGSTRGAFPPCAIQALWALSVLAIRGFCGVEGRNCTADAQLTLEGQIEVWRIRERSVAVHQEGSNREPPRRLLVAIRQDRLDGAEPYTGLQLGSKGLGQLTVFVSGAHSDLMS